MLDGLRVGFIGAGAMAEAMLRGLGGSGAVFTASDPDPARRAKMEADHGASPAADNRALVDGAEMVILAVKPQVAPAVLDEVDSAFRPGQILLSIVAGLPLARLGRGLPPGVGLIRAMPNAPALINAGVTGVSLAGRHAGEREAALGALAPLGRVVFLPEHLLDAVTGLSGSGPAYVAVFAEALIEAGVKNGLARPAATELALHTILGAALMLTGGEAPSALRERVTSPGGTTSFGLYALERGGFRAAVIEAVSAAAERAAFLGRGYQPDTRGERA
ncbi:MAG: pyrroline-5-carboxylate reductase [Patescibacteria group bacterium]